MCAVCVSINKRIQRIETGELVPGYSIDSSVLKSTQDIEQEWRKLQKNSKYSYFQSWGWIETWLDLIAIKLQPIIIRVWCEGRLVGMGLFVTKDIKRRVVFQVRTMYLNESPFDGKNMITEYNGLLAARGHANEVYSEVLAYLLYTFKEHDEFCFGALPETSACYIADEIVIKNARCLVNEQSVSRYIKLSELQSGIDNYLATLSRNRRGQIRRSMRLYDNEGSLQIKKAESVEQAQTYMDRLKVLHTDYWCSKGKGGSFTEPLWEKFHRRLIQRRFERGEIQFLKVSNHHGEIAYIYNFVLNKHVYVVQTGLVRTIDKRLMPGYVAHSMAIAYNRAKGMHIYDLMYGDALYKRILCNREQKLQWLVVQRKRLKFTVERTAVTLVRFFRGES